MPALLRNALIVLALAFVGFQAFVWYQVEQRFQPAKDAFSAYGDLGYGWASASLGGEVTLHRLSIQPYGMAQALEIDAARFDFGSLPGMLSFDPLKGGASNHWKASVEGVRLPTNDEFASDLEQQYVQLSQAPIDEVTTPVLGCGDYEYVSFGALRGMGYDELVFDLFADLNIDLENGFIETGARVLMEDGGDTRFSLRITGDRFSLQTFPVALLSGQAAVDNLSISMIDTGYNQRQSAFCAAQEGSDAKTFNAAQIDVLREGLEELGIFPNDTLYQVYEDFLQGENRIDIRFNPSPHFDVKSANLYSADQILQLLGTEIELNNEPVTGFSVDIDQQRLQSHIQAAAQQGQAPATRAAPRSVPQPALPTPNIPRGPSGPGPQSSYQPVAPDKLVGHVGSPVKATMDDGKTYEGVLESVSDTKIHVKVALHGGSVTYPLALARLAKTSVYTR